MHVIIKRLIIIITKVKLYYSPQSNQLIYVYTDNYVLACSRLFIKINHKNLRISIQVLKTSQPHVRMYVWLHQ